jgi:hypothetical protein
MYKQKQFSKDYKNNQKAYDKELENMFLRMEQYNADLVIDSDVIEKCIKLVEILKFQLKGNSLMPHDKVDDLEMELHEFIANNNVTSQEKIKLMEILCDMCNGAYTNDELVEIKKSLTKI